jgi:hypothetical protein
MICLFAGPFGLEMGQSFEELQQLGANPIAITGSKGYFYVTPPSTHSEFEKYLVHIDNDEGVFWIKAIGKDIDDSGYGFNTKSDFDDIRSMLDNAYGKSEIIDILLPDSLWDDPKYWMMGIKQSDRMYSAHWDFSDNPLKSGDIKEIYLSVQVLSSSKGYLVLEYYGTDFDRLSNKAKQVAAQVF